MAGLSKDVMYNAVISNEEQYDGVFFYAVKTTGIVCRPSCKSKVPNRDNVIFFTNLEEAIRQGYRPCKRCRPDIGPCYAPTIDAVEAACDIISQEYDNPGLLRELPHRLGISSSHFQRLFKKTIGQTPKEYLQKIRIAKAAELLSNSTISNIDVCLAAGFTNLSSFYAAFRSEIGLPPKEYRQEQARKGSLQ
ncbi:MAG: helix-turn-helix domain-containing protein [Firmicutes bacterium]|nr:helix-turn-helix domain-containing protein [Bacillota bacterium]